MVVDLRRIIKDAWTCVANEELVERVGRQLVKSNLLAAVDDGRRKKTSVSCDVDVGVVRPSGLV